MRERRVCRPFHCVRAGTNDVGVLEFHAHCLVVVGKHAFHCASLTVTQFHVHALHLGRRHAYHFREVHFVVVHHVVVHGIDEHAQWVIAYVHLLHAFALLQVWRVQLKDGLLHLARSHTVHRQWRVDNVL